MTKQRSTKLILVGICLMLVGFFLGGKYLANQLEAHVRETSFYKATVEIGRKLNEGELGDDFRKRVREGMTMRETFTLAGVPISLDLDEYLLRYDEKTWRNPEHYVTIFLQEQRLRR